SNPTNSPCWANSLGYKCCSNPNTEPVYYDQDGEWGVENGEWCGIIKKESCWAEPLGYNCCTTCSEVYYTDNDGKWSIENDNWCGLN
ncbi:Non-catalytic module family DOC2, partial [Piromyces sp. E2]